MPCGKRWPTGASTRWAATPTRSCATPKMGDGEFWSVKPGFDGVGFIVPSLLDGGYHRRGLPLGRSPRSWRRARRRSSACTRRRAPSPPGSDADLVLVDLDAEHTVGDEATAVHSDFSIFDGMTFRGWPVMTISRGEVIADRGKWSDARAAAGICARRDLTPIRER